MKNTIYNIFENLKIVINVFILSNNYADDKRYSRKYLHYHLLIFDEIMKNSIQKCISKSEGIEKCAQATVMLMMNFITW